MKRITIRTKGGVKGTSKITTKGFSGPACQDATRGLEARLGSVQVDVPTDEMYTAANDEVQFNN